MAKLVFICEKAASGSSVAVQMEEYFAPQVFSFDSRKVADYVKRHEIDLIVVYMRNILLKSEEELIQLFADVKDVPFVLVGTESSCRHCLEQTSGANVRQCIHVPFVMTQFIMQLRGIVREVAKEAEPEQAAPLQKHILVVDDDPVYLRTMMNWLKGTYHVSVVKNGMDALEFLQEETPELILLDYEMPAWNGVETLEKIRAEKKGADIPVMFLTGVTDASVVHSAIQLKPKGYILKDIKQAALLEKIKSILAEG